MQSVSMRARTEKIAGSPSVNRPPPLLLQSFSPIELTRLKRIAQLRAKTVPGLDWRDLLHEALLRVLDGRRRTVVGIAQVTMLAQIMRSVASELRSQIVREQTFDHNHEDNVIHHDENLQPSPEDVVLYREEIARISALFASDPHGLAYVSCLSLGMTGPEIQQYLVLTTAEHETIRKRVRRTIIRHLSTGCRS